MADSRRCYAALLNGLARRNYFGEKELSNGVLKEQIYPKLSDEEFEHLVTKCTALIKSMVAVDMDFNQLEAFLTSQIKKADSGMNEERANAVRKFWKNQRNKIHDVQVQQTQWNSCLKQMSWRIDLKSQARHIEQIDKPTAIVELMVSSNSQTTDDESKKAKVFHFEMDDKKLDQVLSNLHEIKEQISNHSQQ
ncbi:COMM domain-containing protein 1 isoform X1 [Octopus bimaculoides]|uniref:COMM domain-containing protein 1 n=1 Tax=Octopus bimaculoides TaxID=37653 RepID=A0A0L8GRQ0_OCTBM|nr:COMM domain-containing protein 1 isoform X1 [Octopus bimaculoides]|eukprot:XP_014778729.1 PREDICTED: COMM domain-containing protein 1-like [Octopus bimaculoides]